MGAFPDFAFQRQSCAGIIPGIFSLISRSFHGLFRNAAAGRFFTIFRSAWPGRPVTCDAVMIKNAGFKHLLSAGLAAPLLSDKNLEESCNN